MATMLTIHRNVDNTIPGPAPISTYIRSPDEVYDVRDHLLRWIPLELVDVIMDEARYWPTVICSANTSSLMDYWYVLEIYDNNFCCVYTPRLPDWSGEKYSAVKIKQICFTINSCDQGWTTDPGPFKTSYDGSFTWFQAVIARNFHDADGDALMEDVGARIQRSLCTQRSCDRPDVDYIANMWNIQNNCRASPFFREHRVVWSAADKADARRPTTFKPSFAVYDDRQYDVQTGAYRAAGFVQSLLPGDRIGVVMKAKKQAWQNIAESASIEIIYSR